MFAENFIRSSAEDHREDDQKRDTYFVSRECEPCKVQFTRGYSSEYGQIFQ
jgi:hypothetical protein